MALPLAMLKNLQMRTTAKLGLAGVFCCAFITIAFDILRTVETLTEDEVAGSTALWTNLESAIAVIISCLPSFAALFKPRNRKTLGRNVSPYRLRPLVVSDSAKVCMSAGSSVMSGDVGRVPQVAASSVNASSDASFVANVHTADVSSAISSWASEYA